MTHTDHTTHDLSMTLPEALRAVSTPDGLDRERAWGVVLEATVRAALRCRTCRNTGAPEDLAHSLVEAWLANPSVLAEKRGARTPGQAHAFVSTSVSRLASRLLARQAREHTHATHTAALARSVDPVTRTDGRPDTRHEVHSTLASGVLTAAATSNAEVVERARERADALVRDLGLRTDARRNLRRALHERHEVVFESACVADLVARELGPGACEDDTRRAAARMHTRHTRARLALLEGDAFSPGLEDLLAAQPDLTRSDRTLLRCYLARVLAPRP